jgi:hypothetical protein
MILLISCGDNENSSPSVVLSNPDSLSLSSYNFITYDATQKGTTFEDFDGDALRFVIDGLPSGLLDNGDGSFSGTPTANGDFTVRITANDGNGGKVSNEFELYIFLATISLNIESIDIYEGSENGSVIEISLKNSHFKSSSLLDESTVLLTKLPEGVSYRISRANDKQIELFIIGDSIINYDSDIVSSQITIKSSVIEKSETDFYLDGLTFKALLDRDGDGLSDVAELEVYKTNFTVPNQQLNISVAQHRYNAVASMTIDTDLSSFSSLWMAEYLAFKHNIGLTVFDVSDSWLGPRVKNRKEADKTGRMSWGIYLQTDTWLNPDNFNREVIPDYYSTTWTAAGARIFKNAVIGIPKNSRYPNHGQQLWDISGGDFGYDFGLDISGKKDVSSGVIELQLSNFKSLFDYTASSISYKNGQQGISYLLNSYILSGRNSTASTEGDSFIDYSDNLRDVDFISRESSTRWLSPGGGDDKSTSYCISEVERSISSGGFWNNFTHFHNINTVAKKEQWQLFMEYLDETTSEEFVYWDGYSEITQYFYLRKALLDVQAFEDGSDVVIKFDMNSSLKDLNSFRVPLSFVLDLRGTKLSGKEIGVGQSVSVRKIESDLFNIEIKPDTLTGPTIIKLSGTSDYLNLNRPTIISASEANGEVTVITDLPTRIALFHTSRGDEDNSVNLIYRGNVLTTIHHINLNKSEVRNYQSEILLADLLSGDIYFGAITSSGQSNTSGPFQW